MCARTEEALNHLRSIVDVHPKVAVILGSGLSSIAKRYRILQEIDYETIPGFPRSSVEGHAGRMVFAGAGSGYVVIFQGRFHYYEGYSDKEMLLPLLLLKKLGVEKLIITNASGGLNPLFNPGDIMIIDDQINLLSNPLIGNFNIEPMIYRKHPEPVYNKEMTGKLKEIASAVQIPVKNGIYIGVPGPVYETKAEYTYYRKIGGDAIGMSTTSEAITARHLNIKCSGMSVITNCYFNDTATSHEEVQEVAGKAEKNLSVLIGRLVEEVV